MFSNQVLDFAKRLLNALKKALKIFKKHVQNHGEKSIKIV
jgi:hypothetical protein